MIICVLAFISLHPGTALGQTKKSTPQMDKLKRLFQERDPLKESMSQFDKMKEEFSYTAQGLNAAEAEMLRTLQDPFVPQLPEPVTEVEPAPTPKPRPLSQPDTRTPAPVPPQPDVPAIPMVTAPPPNLRISGLIWNSDRPQAIVNGQIVEVGGTIDSWKITDISKKGVEISYNDQTFLIEP